MMIRKFKVLGLALVAVFALTAVASAAEFHSESSTGNTFLEGSQTTANVFTVTNPKGTKVADVHCSSATFTGTQTGKTVSSVEVHPTYAGCEASPFGSAEVETDGCTYNLHSAGTVDIVCAKEFAIKIVAPGCTITVGGGQSGLSSVNYSNSGSPSTVTALANVEKIAYKASGGLCSFFNVPSSGTLGDYAGGVNVKGYVDMNGTKGAQTAIKWE
jgi:hypothetical protein